MILDERNLPGSTLAGIVITGMTDSNLPHTEFLNEFKIPVVSCPLDTYGAAVRISAMEVKINLKTPWKIRRAVELIEEHCGYGFVAVGGLGRGETESAVYSC